MCYWLSKELNKFNDTNAGKRNEYRRKLKEEEKLKRQQEGDLQGPDGEDNDNEEERAAKRARIGEEEGEDPDGGVRLNGHADGAEKAVNGEDGGDEDEPIDVDDNEDDGNENEEEEQEEPEEEEEEEDDEDEFPDEGRRLSSVEAETYSEGEARAGQGSEDEAMSDDEGSD